MGKIKALVSTYNRIFFKNKALLIFSVIFPIIFYIFFTLIFTNYDDVNKVPIAVIDQDHSILSEKMLDELSDHASLSVKTTDLDEGYHLIKRNKIEAIFIIKDGFEEKIKTTEFEESIQLIYLDKSNIGPALGDIIAGTIISDLAIYNAANTSIYYGDKYGYEDMYKKVEAIGYQLLEENTFEMTIESQVKKPKALIDEDLDIQSILKSHTTFGFSLVMFSFVFLFANSHLIDSKTLGIEQRLITLGYKNYELFTGQWLSLFTTGFLMTLFQIIFIIITFKINTLSQVVILVATYLMHYIFLINLTMIMTRVISYKNRYQSLIAPLLFILGLTGGAFWSIELLSDSFMWAANISPFYWSLKLLDQMILSAYDASVKVWLLYYLLVNIVLSVLSYLYYQFYYSFKLKS